MKRKPKEDRLTLNKMSEEISKRIENISAHTVKEVLNVMLDVWIEHLMLGKEVYLKRFGSLFLRSLNWCFHEGTKWYNPLAGSYRRGTARIPEVRFSECLRRAISKKEVGD